MGPERPGLYSAEASWLSLGNPSTAKASNEAFSARCPIHRNPMPIASRPSGLSPCHMTLAFEAALVEAAAS